METKESLVEKLIVGLNVLTQDQIEVIGRNLEKLVHAEKASGQDIWVRSDLLHYLNGLKKDVNAHDLEIFLFLGLVTGVVSMAKVYKDK